MVGRPGRGAARAARVSAMRSVRACGDSQGRLLVRARDLLFGIRAISGCMPHRVELFAVRGSRQPTRGRAGAPLPWRPRAQNLASGFDTRRSCRFAQIAASSPTGLRSPGYCSGARSHEGESRTTHFGPLTRQVVRGGSSWRLARRWLSVVLPFTSWPGDSFCDPTDAFGCRLQWLHYFPDLVKIADHRAQCFDQARHP